MPHALPGVRPYANMTCGKRPLCALGSLLEQYGTYESNGIAFNDENEIWWLETIGGHHWIAKKVKDEEYVIMPNRQGIDSFDLNDALKEQKEHMCSSDLKEAGGKYSALRTGTAYKAADGGQGCQTSRSPITIRIHVK